MSAVCLYLKKYVSCLFTYLILISAICLHLWYWYQPFVYICDIDIRYLFTFVYNRDTSDVCLHLQCQFQLLVYKSNTKYQHHFWRENWKSQEIPFRNENSNETLFVHFKALYNGSSISKRKGNLLFAKEKMAKNVERTIFATFYDGYLVFTVQ